MNARKITNVEQATIEEYSHQEDCPSDIEAKIAELAYFKAEQRGFVPGHEMEDWYEAEREILAQESESS